MGFAGVDHAQGTGKTRRAEVWQRMFAFTRRTPLVSRDIGANGPVKSGSAPKDHLKGLSGAWWR